jgi:Xaa-Pro aminopeptidase
MRIKKLIETLHENQLDAYIITREPNIYYFTGSNSGGLLLIPIDETPTLFTSVLNYNIAVDQAKGVRVESFKRSEFIDRIVGACEDLKPEKIGFDELSLSSFNSINEKIDSGLIQSSELAWSLRRIKEKKELSNMKKAAEQADAGMKSAFDAMQVGITEYELAAEASYAMRRKGADDYAFPFIVASGFRSAYPHAGVSDRKLNNGDFITIDMGARYRGYCIDLTRTFILGEPTKKQRDIYNAVYKANTAAFPHYKEGSRGLDVDKVSRDIIEQAGYGEYYIHGLGHGIGLEVHEPPSISQRSEDTLISGNVVSNEPGIYLHGYGGVRIEDSVHVTEGYPIALTEFPKEIESVIVK